MCQLSPEAEFSKIEIAGNLPSIGCFPQKLTQIWRNHWPFWFIGRFGIFQISCRQLRHTLWTNHSLKPTNKKAKPSRPVAGNLLRRRKEKNLRNNLKSVSRVSGRIYSYGENSSFNMNRIAMIIINFICMLIAPKEKDTHQSLGGVHAWRERGGAFKRGYQYVPPSGPIHLSPVEFFKNNLKKIWVYPHNWLNSGKPSFFIFIIKNDDLSFYVICRYQLETIFALS